MQACKWLATYIAGRRLTAQDETQPQLTGKVIQRLHWNGAGSEQEAPVC